MRTVFRQICIAVIVAGLLLGPAGASPGYAQAPVAGAGPPPVPLSAQQLEDLVGRIALYPDDLLAIVLPAATFPLDIVQADRFLQKLKQDKNLKPDARWDESIRNLLNYPEVISMMSQDLDWTQGLGEAVVSQQADVIKAIQQFRAKAATAGNLKSDDKQVIVQEQQVIKIVPANPEVIYVPQYQPSTVIVYQPAPVWAYYPTPYPVYYYPYPPGAAFATGFFWGATTAWACNWGGGRVENNVNISNTTNLNINRNNPQYQQQAQQARQQAQQRAQQPTTQQARQQAQQRAGGQGGATAWQSQKRPGEVSSGRVSPSTAAARPGYGAAGASQRSEFGNPGRGSEATRDANRGTQSRSSASTMNQGARPSTGASMGGGAGHGGAAATASRGSAPGGGASAGGASRGGVSSGGGGASRGGGGTSRGGGVRRK